MLVRTLNVEFSNEIQRLRSFDTEAKRVGEARKQNVSTYLKENHEIPDD